MLVVPPLPSSTTTVDLLLMTGVVGLLVGRDEDGGRVLSRSPASTSMSSAVGCGA